MNQIAHISYEDRAKARASEVRRRLMGTPKRVNIIREVLAQAAEKRKSPVGKILEADADAHVRAYRQWVECAFKRTTMMDYMAMEFEQEGTSLAQIRHARRNRVLVLILDRVVLKTKLMFAHRPLSDIAQIVNREHSTIVRCCERESLRLGITKPDFINDKFPKIEAYLREGKSLKEIAEIYEVGISTISRKVHKLGISHLLQTKTKTFPMEFIESVHVEYAAGMTFNEISRKYGVSKRAVVNWKNTFGWSPRRKARAE